MRSLANMRTILTLAAWVTGCVRPATIEGLPLASELVYFGPDHVQVDMLRTVPEGSRIFVQATMPDGVKGLFLIDTGAAISVLSESTAQRLSLDIQRNYGYVEGLGGRARLDYAVVDNLALGEAIVPEVSFAVGVRGAPEYAGFMPLDGILGNNVWSRFVLEVDYPADTLVLHRPGTVRMPRRSSPMVFDGNHVFAPLQVQTETDPPMDVHVVVQVDTGAGELLLHGPSALGPEAPPMYTEGLEAVYGIGASEIMPPSRFLVRTRRVALARVGLGGAAFDVEDVDARWLNYDGQSAEQVSAAPMQGLGGHELLSDHNVFFDYQGGALALRKSRRRPRALDGHEVLLAQDLDLFGPDAPERAKFRAEMHAALAAREGGDPNDQHLLRAVELMETYLAEAQADDLAEARVTLAGLHRYRGDLESAWEVLAPLTPDELVREGQIVAAVNGFLLDEQPDAAMALADAAVAAATSGTDGTPLSVIERSTAHVARADVLLATGDAEGSNRDLLLAAEIVENPDAHLLRRSRVALARGDRYGAIAHVRRLLQLYPSEGTFLWFYALLVDGDEDTGTFRADMEHAMSRLHPPRRPIDFMVAAHRTLGDSDEATVLMEEGIRRDCNDGWPEPSRDNCVAWYSALAGVDLDDSLTRIERALDVEGDRSDFLDTKAMVHLARGEYAQAYASAMAAARLSPDDIYMLWQAERLQDLVDAEDGSR